MHIKIKSRTITNYNTLYMRIIAFFSDEDKFILSLILRSISTNYKIK